jgi:hypothetical protein
MPRVVPMVRLYLFEHPASLQPFAKGSGGLLFCSLSRQSFDFGDVLQQLWRQAVPLLQIARAVGLELKTPRPK